MAPKANSVVIVVTPIPCRGCTFCGGDCTDGFDRPCPRCVAS